MRKGLSPRTLFAAPIPVAAFLALATALPAQAQGEGADLKANLQIDIPTVQFSEISVSDDGTKLTIPFLANYITGIYTYAVGIATVVAAVMAVVGGFQYLTAGGDAGRVKAGKERITDAIAGLILTLLAYTILNTVSPALIQQKGLVVDVVKGAPILSSADLKDDPADNAAPTTGGRQGNFAYCRSLEECRTKCKEDRPTSWGNNPAPSEMKPIQDGPGIQGGGKLASQAVVTGLLAAGKIADATAPGYIIVVKSGYRPFKQQLDAICSMIDKGDTSTLGSSVAWPGASNHGTGAAVDVQLIEKNTGKVVVGSTNCSRQAASGDSALATPEMAKLLAKIMADAGGVRYANEIWHFEFGDGASKSCRCKGDACPLPPMACKGNC